MNNLNQLLGIAAASASITKARLIQRFVNDLARVITLAIAAGFMAGALLIGIFYIAYQGLIHYGLQPLPAEIMLGGIGVLTVATLIAVTSARVQKIKNIPAQIVHTEFPLASKLNSLVDSFIEGLLAPTSTET